MSVNVFPSETKPATLPASIRAKGRLALVAERAGARTIARRVREEGPLRVRFPRIVTGGRLEAILINIAGGVVGGDQLAFDIEAGGGAELCLTTQAAEKVYRSTGEVTALSVRLRAGENAKLAWQPQETILFDGVNVTRALDADVERGATLTICESVIFGRTAMGERVARGQFSDRWRIRRRGTLVFADTFKIGGDIDRILGSRAIAAGAGATATLLQIAPATEAKICRIREIVVPDVELGASAFDGMIVVRMIARGSLALRRAVLCTLDALGAPPPRAFTL